MGDLREDVVQLAKDLQAFKWYYSGCSAVLFYDYVLTFAAEVKHVWKGRRGLVFYLFLLNRYIPMIFCIVTLFAYFSALWTSEVCQRFAIVEWLQALLVVLPAETMLLIRVNALMGHRKLIYIPLILLLLAQCIVVVYAMAQPGENNALHLPDVPIDPFHVCILYSNPKMDIAYLSICIAFDSIVFTITLLATMLDRSLPRPHQSPVIRTIQWDGALYFCAILSGTVTWMVLSIHGRPGIKLMNAQPSMLLTSIMVSRLTLSLRRANQKAQMFATSMNTQSDLPLNILDSDGRFSDRQQPPTRPRRPRPRPNTVLPVYFTQI
ncbi:hypothetical protein K435DRAFT_48840 [Dendrothele bispora CBS 962.96]|uniref:DUF6533 domain-containing protein n=1 Tax=Dendrothele bispora (strain CBS 962.96) TaxID=1314807 RepID=A0A4S8M7W6_DENBC|nr:hypothetical protein K435DRAFT_48840 [Dendrothele bispora CBS 962.96]